MDSHPPKRIEFAAVLERLLATSGYSRKEWAARLVVSASAVSQWATGATLPSPKSLAGLLQLAGEAKVPAELVRECERFLDVPLAELGVKQRRRGEETLRPDVVRAQASGVVELLSKLPIEERAAFLDEAESYLARRDPGVGDGFSGVPPGLIDQLEGLLAGAPDPVIRRLLEYDLQSVARSVVDLSAGLRYEKWARPTSEHILGMFTGIVEALPDGGHWHYETISNLDFWSEHTLSSRWKFLSAQQAAHQERGVGFRRVFLVPKSREALTESERERLAEHLKFQKWIEASVAPKEMKVEDVGNLVLVGPGAGVDSVLLEIHFRSLPGPDASGGADPVREIERVTADTDVQAIRGSRALFDQVWEQAEPLDQYLGGVTASA